MLVKYLFINMLRDFAWPERAEHARQVPVPIYVVRNTDGVSANP